MKASTPRAPSTPISVPLSTDEEEISFEERIARRAYELWQQEGCPEGRETNFWQEAERQLKVEAADQTKSRRSLDQADGP